MATIIVAVNDPHGSYLIQLFQKDLGEGCDFIGPVEMVEDVWRALQKTEGVDVLLLSAALPGGQGVQPALNAVWDLRRQYPKTRIVYLSGREIPPDVKSQLVAARVNDWYNGPLSHALSDLVRAGRSFEDVAGELGQAPTVPVMAGPSETSGRRPRALPGSDPNGAEQPPPEPSKGKRGAGLLGGLGQLAKRAVKKDAEVAPEGADRSSEYVFLAHPLILVWGYRRTSTTLNLAVAAARHGIDVVAANLDWESPTFDRWIGAEESSGPMTLAHEMEPSVALRMLVEKWGVRWLPAGQRLDNIGTPDLTVAMGQGANAMLDDVIAAVYRRPTGNRPALTLMDAGRSFEELATLAGFRQASQVLLVSSGDPVRDAELALQVGWLCQIHLAAPENLIFLGQPGGPNALEVRFKDSMTGRQVRANLVAAAELPEDKGAYQESARKRQPEALVPGAWDVVLEAVVGTQMAGRHGKPRRRTVRKVAEA